MQKQNFNEKERKWNTRVDLHNTIVYYVRDVNMHKDDNTLNRFNISGYHKGKWTQTA